MRIALVLSGQPRFADIAYHLSLLDYELYDVFFHTWKNDEHPQIAPWISRENLHLSTSDELFRMFEPKKFSITQQNDFENDEIRNRCLGSPEINALYHMFKSLQMADLNRQAFEIQNKIRYDLVIRCRFDFLALSKIMYQPIPNNLVLTPYLLDRRPVPCDWFFLSTSLTMTKVSNLFFEFIDYLNCGIAVSGEAMLKHHFAVNGIENTNYKMSGLLIRDRKLKDVRFGRVKFSHNKSIWFKKFVTTVKGKLWRQLAFVKKILLSRF